MNHKKPPASFNSRFDEGLDGIEVSLHDTVSAGQAADLISVLYWSTWGDPIMKTDTGDGWFTAQQAIEGKVLPNCLETVNLTFSINGISRACTHQLVRSRVGVGFGQQGGRDNNWSNFNFRIPASLERSFETTGDGDALVKAMETLNALYKSAIADGVPYQDARYILPMGLETGLVGTYNLLALKGTLQRRLCNRMMWETNYVARLMADLTVARFPWVGRNLRSTCELRGTCQSVSQMFPPSCLSMMNGAGLSRYAKDNPTLKTEMNDGADFDWSRQVNGAHEHFIEQDLKRLDLERRDAMPSVRSLVDGNTVLAVQTKEGRWIHA